MIISIIICSLIFLYDKIRGVDLYILVYMYLILLIKFDDKFF